MVLAESKASLVEEVERRYRIIMEEPISQAAEIGHADVVVGIPFYNEVDTLPQVIETAVEGLERFFPDKKCVIVAVGAPAGGEALRAINAIPVTDKVIRLAFLLSDERISGRGWSIRAIMRIARNLGADLAILEADVGGSCGKVEGAEDVDGVSGEDDDCVEELTPDWIRLLLDPIIKENMDLVVSRFNQNYFDMPISAHVTYPLFAAIYGHCIHDVVGVEWGISHRMVRTYLQEPGIWNTGVGGYGVDVWLATTAIVEGARICEANMGVRFHKPSPRKQELVFKQAAKVLFERIVADYEWWEKRGDLLHPLPSFGVKGDLYPEENQPSSQALMFKYRQGFGQYQTIYQRVLPDHICQRLDNLGKLHLSGFEFPAELWSQIVYRFILAFAFGKEFGQEDLLTSLVPLYQGRMAGAILDTQFFTTQLEPFLSGEEMAQVGSLVTERNIEEQVNEFNCGRATFLCEWARREEALKPSLPKVTYREFIPGVPLVVPWDLTTSEGKIVRADSIYNSLAQKYREEFDQFVFEKLSISREASSLEIAQGIKDFMHDVEGELDKALLPGDLFMLEGVAAVAEAIFDYFPHRDTFVLKSETANWVLHQLSPTNLITRLGHGNLDDVLLNYDPKDVLALASWSEGREYMDSVEELLIQEIRPEHFESCSLEPIVVEHGDFPALADMKELSALNKLTGRIVLSNLPKGMGGEFPKLRYFTMIAKNIVEAERFGDVWRMFANDRKEFSRRVVKSLEGHWGSDPLSAHFIFESGHQQVLVKRMRQMSRRIAAEAGKEELRCDLARHLRDIADSYHVALTLPDGRFVTCSAWTWASYSFKGGREFPTPLSSRVEKNWSSQEFLTEYYKAVGGDEEKTEDKIVELMGQGKESADLSPILLGGRTEANEVMSKYVAVSDHPPSGCLTRFSGNPILEPIVEHSWESKYVLNAAAIRLAGKVYIVYRAFGDDEISRLGLAISIDGFKIEERLETPIFEPAGQSEQEGCEDPRLILIGSRVYMLYTAYSGQVAQIAMASIEVDHFLDCRWDMWQRHGLVFPGFPDKDGIVFPTQFEGKYAIIHRVDPNVWISFSSDLSCPWPKTDHSIIAGPRAGMVWDGEKIGAGAQPIRTKYGWLLICHGVSYATVYRLGVMLLDLEQPSELLYRSPNFILEPEKDCELGEKEQCWVSNVVFTCGAVSVIDKDVLDDEDEILVYYGAADTVICVATARISELIPEEIRQGRRQLNDTLL